MSSTTPPAPDAPEREGPERGDPPERGQQRRRGGVRDLVLSLAVLLALVGVFVLAAPRESGNPPRAIDFTDALVHARGVAHFPVVAPVGLPAGWQATGTRTDERDGTVHWHLAMLTPNDKYASVDQSDRPATDFVAEMTERGGSRGTVRIGGRTWIETYAQLRDHRSLWTSGPDGSTTVVGGTARWAALEQLARSLRGPSAPGR